MQLQVCAFMALYKCNSFIFTFSECLNLSDESTQRLCSRLTALWCYINFELLLLLLLLMNSAHLLYIQLKLRDLPQNVSGADLERKGKLPSFPLMVPLTEIFLYFFREIIIQLVLSLQQKITKRAWPSAMRKAVQKSICVRRKKPPNSEWPKIWIRRKTRERDKVAP